MEPRLELCSKFEFSDIITKLKSRKARCGIQDAYHTIAIADIDRSVVTVFFQLSQFHYVVYTGYSGEKFLHENVPLFLNLGAY